MSLGTILVIILVIFLLGGFSGRFGGYGYGFGHGGVGIIGIILIVVVAWSSSKSDRWIAGETFLLEFCRLQSALHFGLEKVSGTNLQNKNDP